MVQFTLLLATAAQLGQLSFLKAPSTEYRDSRPDLTPISSLPSKGAAATPNPTSKPGQQHARFGLYCGWGCMYQTEVFLWKSCPAKYVRV